MPLIGFDCKRGKVLFSHCFAYCPEAERCRPLAVLKQYEFKRKLTGYSTTELIQPTCQMYLKKTTDYYESPDNMEYALEGKMMHSVLDTPITDALQEERIKDEINSGSFDLYRNGVLEDYKRIKSYKIKMMLKNGPVVSAFDYCLQLNDYRMKLEAAGFKVNEMALWVCCSDFGFLEKKAIQRWNRFIIPPLTNTARLKSYFIFKKNELEKFDKAGAPLYACKDRENWNGRRCQDYCPAEVKARCPKPKEPIKKEPKAKEKAATS